ncbi:MTH1187 family thiamine-binding protein [Alkalihalobacillus sp. LMS39]|uniref:MTH1187 family thiamine-binding protein n=1 Tax=Alkalihalobacillus sp. LMS39 TaxID=2924032 RepID=UPI001FB1D587|nr:MTH1187 family thiamine-binding protein [Alkalihalobacillus sp. LMS39]UOE95744.1 MTH1187 family thiamine-binding protein [Alkalihalobacillus sp. LMS39]
MLIRGISFQKGVFFIGKDYVSCAYSDNGKLIKEWVKPLEASTALVMARLVFFSMPLWYKILTAILISLVVIPKIGHAIYPDFIPFYGLPDYVLLYYAFGTHFIFPTQLKKYHGAEHKVFSDRGMKRMARLYQIRKAAITNRFCSTNLVVVYFSLVLVGSIVLSFLFPPAQAIMWASYSAVFISPPVNKALKYRALTWVRSYVLAVSYFLQKKVTTMEPERHHMITAIRSYRGLAKAEFPEALVVKRKQKVEEKKMAIVDVTIIPIGTENASVSEYVADIHHVLEGYGEKIKFQLTPMSTIIEGELPVLFEVIQAIHEVPFKAGINRVATNIRIDDRRDKPSSMEGKVEAVQTKIAAKKQEDDGASKNEEL